MIYGVYTAALGAAMVLYAPAAVARRVVRGVPLNLRARLGLDAKQAATRCGWVHAVSVGEAITAAPIIHGLAQHHPELPLVVTTVTPTGARVVRERFGAVATHRFFPIDLPRADARVVGALDPAFLICMETEIWPNMLRLLAARGVPVMIANGRLSDRSFRRYRLVRGFMRDVLGHVRVFGMQTGEDARRIIALGADPERVVVTGNLKHEPVATTGSADLWRRLLGLAPGMRVWVAGSTHRGEEHAVLEAYGRAREAFPELALVIAPRHPERVPEVMRLLTTRGIRAVRRSQLPRRQEADPVIVLDTVGELAQLYSVAEIVFVGGSLIAGGGHNMLEPALQRKPVLFGPHTENFREPAALLTGAGGARVVGSATELAEAVVQLLGDEALREKMAQAGFEAVASRHGAVRTTLELVDRFLYPRAAP